MTADRYYTFGGATVAMRHGSQVNLGASPPVTGIWYLFGDIQGSIRAMVSDARDTNGDPDPANAIINRNAYTPYGQTRGGTQLDSDRGWLGQITDEAATGLVYLNARYYDPVAARFVSPDPFVNPFAAASLDRYGYAYGNPVELSDPTGESPRGCNWFIALFNNCDASSPLAGSSGSDYLSDQATDFVHGGAIAANDFRKSLTWSNVGQGLKRQAEATVLSAVVSPAVGAALTHYHAHEDARNLVQNIQAQCTGNSPGGCIGYAFTTVALDVELVVVTSLALAALAWIGDAIAIAAYSGARSVASRLASTVLREGEEWVTVGRWMGEYELEYMQKNGRVLEGGSGRTYVAYPSDPSAFQAGKGSYVEFEVPASALMPASKPNYRVIPGPNAKTGIYGSLPSEMPPARCVSVRCVR